MASKGLYLGMAGIGGIFLWSGVKGKSWSSVMRNLISGQSPNKASSTQQITGLDATTTSAVTGMVNAQGLVNPVGPGLVRGRIDEGVDFTGTGPLFAITSGRIMSVHGPWPGGIYISLHGDDGNWYYYAENIVPVVSTGQHISAGQLIGHAVGVYPFIELGIGSPIPFTPAAHSHYSEGVPTPEGEEFASLLSQLGAP